MEGSLYELISRGNKDAYFFQDMYDSKFIFDNTYESQAETLSELRRVPPRTAAEFGRTVDFDFDLVGDLMREPAILITLPSWLPPQQAATNNNSLISDASGVTYGYTNGIAYFLFEQIQVYQDNILLQEFSGDALWAESQVEGTLAESRMNSEQAGQHTGTALEIGRNATPLSPLRLKLPVIGCQTKSDAGFPQRALQSHTFRLRCKLRRLEDLVEASDGRQKPAPWGRNDFQQTLTANGQPQTFSTLARNQIQPLLLQLETRQVYVNREMQDKIAQTPAQIPFKRIYENIFTQSPADYLSVQGGSTSTVSRRLDARHPADRLLWFFRRKSDMQANQLWKLYSGYNQISFLIAGQTRESPRAPAIWRDAVNYAKEEIDSGMEISTMNWSLGYIAQLRFPGTATGQKSQPTGSVEMTTADKPTFYIDLANPGVGDQMYTELRVIVSTWAIYQNDGKGRGELFSAN
jgi:hypothetical protein